MSSAELERLDRFQRGQRLATRSDAVRELVRAAASLDRPGAIELSVSVRRQLEELVEDGWSGSLAAAIETMIELGLREWSRTINDELPKAKGRARELAQRGDRSAAADRRGRGLLRR